ncbi:MAG: hypothetical protein ACYTG0_25230 [Planctomycetota bacterium]|jgi:hypothetical protein
MSSRAAKTFRLMRVLAFVGLLVGVVIAWRGIRQARRAGAALTEMLASGWPEQSGPQLGTRERLLAAARKMQEGDFRAAARDLQPAGEPSAREKADAQAFFREAPFRKLRTRFLAAAKAGGREEAEGADVAVVREALARALQAAARNDQSGVEAHVGLAERALDGIAMGGIGRAGPAAGGPEAVARLIGRIEPAFTLGRDLMTEGHVAVEKLVGRASWHAQREQYREALSLAMLAHELLAVEPSGEEVSTTPEWFDALAREPSASATDAQATAAVDLCEAMSAAESPSKPVESLVQKARRELEAGRSGEAYWWASVALNALGTSDDAVAAAAGAAEDEEQEEAE